MKHFGRLTFLALAGSVSIVPAAQAATPDEVASRVKAVFANQDVDLTWAEAVGNGTNVVLKSVTVGVPGEAERVAVGDVSLNNVEEESDGDLVVGTLDLPHYSYSNSGLDFSVDGVSLSDLVLPAANSTDPMASVGIFRTLQLGKIGATMSGKPVFAMENLTYDIERSGDGNVLSFKGGAKSFSADLNSISDPQTLAMATALGLANFNGSFETAGGWSLSDGQLNLKQMDFAIADAGKLGVTFAVDGYTPEVAKTIREMQKKVAAAPDDQKSAAGMAYLGLLQQLSLGGATIRYDEDKLAGRALDMAAGAQGMKRADLSALARMLLPTYLGQYVGPDFAAKASAAVATFLENPKSLEISAAPQQPVPFALVGAAAMTAPQTLPAQIGLTVKANE